MKLISLHLKSFLKHEDLKVEFTEDLNVLRGPNEGGKSSLVEGFGYFISGSTALAESVDATVNWDAKSKSDMKVIGVFKHNKKLYTATRGPSGAEVIGEDGKVLVTGQKPVTTFLENLLNLPPGRASHVMLASQNEIRGVLALGPTAAGQFIEKLADFSEIDALLKKAVATLPTGDAKALEAQIETAKQNISEIVVPEIPDHEDQLEDLKNTKEIAEGLIAEVNEKVTKQKTERSAALERKTVLRGEDIKAKKRLDTAEKEVSDLAKLMKEEDSLRAKAELLNKQFEVNAARAVYDEVTELEYPEDVWDEDMVSLEAEILKVRNRLIDQTEKLTVLKTERSAAAAKSITDAACPTCGHIKGDPQEIEAHNLKVQEETDKFDSRIAAAKLSEDDITEELTILRSLVAAQEGIQKQAQNWPEHCIEWDKTVIPHKPSFKGAAPDRVDMAVLGPQMAEIQTKLAALPEDSKQALAVAGAKAEAAKGTWTKIGRELAELAIPDVQDFTQLLEGAQKDLDESTSIVNMLAKEVNDAKVLQTAANAEIERWQKTIDEANVEIDKNRDNVVFIKALKEARLKVSEKLWGVIMTGVSSYFSQFRGRPSIVAKTEKGFLVDGKAGRPSGSTLDILGLALRIVIAKVFANSGLLVVDEPTANCDDVRKANVAGVLKSSGFEQIIWVSHDNISESGAANLIEL